jgi:hypothetical protein
MKFKFAKHLKIAGWLMVASSVPVFNSQTAKAATVLTQQGRSPGSAGEAAKV